MKALIDNEGKIVGVTEEIYNELKTSFNDGVWCVIVTVGKRTHSVILTENF